MTAVFRPPFGASAGGNGGGGGGPFVIPWITITDPPPSGGGGLAFDENVFSPNEIGRTDTSANSFSYPAEFESGDMAVIAFITEGDDSVSIPASYTEIGTALPPSSSGSFTGVRVCYRILDGTEGASESFTKTGTSGQASVTFYRVTGASGISADVAEYEAPGFFVDSWDVPSINAGGGLDVIIGGFSDAVNFSTPARLFDGVNVAGRTFGVFVGSVESGATGTKTVTSTSTAILYAVRFCIEE